MSTSKIDKETDICRILVLGSHRTRLERVFDLLDGEIAADKGNVEKNRIEFLPGVATFDSYEDESGNTVRYLVKIDYFPRIAQGRLEQIPHSLLQFFDESRPNDNDPEDDTFWGITAAILGSGLDKSQDAEKIQTFLDTMSPMRRVPVESLQPNTEFGTMTDEFAAFRALDADAKAAATRNRTMGPAKVAQFAWDTVVRIIEERQEKRQAAMARTLASIDNGGIVMEEKPAQAPAEAPFIDPDKKRFSCRKCRTILFGQNDLEDPPHVPARHSFGHRKAGGNSSRRDEHPCQSIFLNSVPLWVAADMSVNEGKIACPKCDAKVGHWNWSGAQCSCGTWVCPAIQVPSSRVDEVLPHAADTLPTGAVVSPLLASLMQSQQQR